MKPEWENSPWHSQFTEKENEAMEAQKRATRQMMAASMFFNDGRERAQRLFPEYRALYDQLEKELAAGTDRQLLFKNQKEILAESIKSIAGDLPKNVQFL